MTDYNLSPTKITTFLTCEEKYKYQYLKNLKAKGYFRALEFGIIGHTLLKHYYKLRALGVEVTPETFPIRTLLEEFEKQRSQSPTSAIDYQQFEVDIAAIEGMILGYIMVYAEKEKGYTFQCIEEDIKDSESFVSPDGNNYFLSGVPDLVLTNRDGEIWVVDHKFLSRIEEGWIRKLPLDYQSLVYIRLVSRLLQKPVRGIIYNIILKPSKRLKQRQTISEYMKEIQDDYILDQSKYFQRVEVICGSGHFDNFETQINKIIGDIERAHKTKQFRRNVTACDARGICPFLDLCLDGQNAMHLYENRY